MNDDDKKDWSIREKMNTFMSSPHECHAFISGLANGLSLGHTCVCPAVYNDEMHYYNGGWFIGEIIDRLSSRTSDFDTRYGIGQIIGTIGIISIIIESLRLIL